METALGQHPDAAFLCMARDIALTHHERYDGTGYPAGLAGDDIPLAGRIVALADVYDAMTSARVYKEPFDHDTARDLILVERGKQFDPDVVDAFVASEKDIIEIRRHFADVALLA